MCNYTGSNKCEVELRWQAKCMNIKNKTGFIKSTALSEK